MLQCLMFQEIGFEQCEGTWFWIVLQGLRWQAGPRWQPQDLHWCHQDFPRWRQGMPKVIEFTFYAPSSDSNLFFYRCGGAVYEAEKVTIKDDPYHKKCLSCNKCGRQLDSLSLSIAPDNNVYCKVRSFHFFQNGVYIAKFCIFPGMLQSCDSSWQASNLHGYGSNCRWRWERRMPSMQRKSFRGWKDDNQKWIVP